MSCYDDIYSDFPLRCAEVWESFGKDAKVMNRDVTLMLMCAAGGFATPWDQLKIPEGEAKNGPVHPAFFNFDRRKYAKCLKEVGKALTGELSDSPLFEHIQFEDAYYGHAKTIDLIRDMAEFRSPRALQLAAQRPRQIVKALRNAIAHNNVYAYARQKGNEISDLTFFSEVVLNPGSGNKVIDHYEVISLSVTDFRTFLAAWFALLRKATGQEAKGRAARGRHLNMVISNALNEPYDRIAA